MRYSTLATSLAALASLARAADPVWPNESDFLEDMLAMQTGYRRFGFTDLVVPCGFDSGVAGRQNAAEWIRTAFHDVATHDVDAGTGGIDASIFYEVDRDENAGAAFNATFADISEFINPRATGADMIALGVVSAAASCGGSRIPLRPGRTDAVAPGPTGVPKPEHDLAATQAAFTRMGFTNEDMITLVACGHTIGGVHGETNPELVAGVGQDPNAAGSRATFDSSPANFDPVVVTEYLEGDGKNPLVFGTNATTNSDARIFGSDGNVTMRAMADPPTFQSKCADVFGRMIDVVPTGVELRDPVVLYDVKPYIDILETRGDGKLAFEGSVRVRTSSNTGIDADALTISLNVQGRDGTNTTVDVPRVRFRGGQSFGFFDEVFTWFDYKTVLDAPKGVKGFTIDITNSATGQTQTLDNSGTGIYPVADELLYMETQSCADFGKFDIRLEAAVRADIAAKGKVPQIELTHKRFTQGFPMPRLETEVIKMTKAENQTDAGYVMFSAETTLGSDEWSTFFDVVLETCNKKIVVKSQRTSSLPQDCQV